MDTNWKNWQVTPQRQLEIQAKNTGWFVRLIEAGETVKTAWPFDHLCEAQAKAVEMAVRLGWFTEPPEGY